jgi:general secretion pathway protein K
LAVTKKRFILRILAFLGHCRIRGLNASRVEVGLRSMSLYSLGPTRRVTTMLPPKNGATPARSKAQIVKRNSGFALVAVVWGLSIITLLILSFVTTSSLRLKTAFNIAGAAQAGLFADAAINMAILSLLSEQNQHASDIVHDGKPFFCSMEVVAVALSIEDESGKIDLNTASPQILNALFSGLGLETSAAGTLADAIVNFRVPPTSGPVADGEDSNDADRPFPAKHAPFATTLELDQVVGVDPTLFSIINRLVTVYSYRPGVNARAAPPALFAALAGFPAENVRDLLQNPFPNNLDRNDGRFPQNFKSALQGGGNPVYLVHVDVLAASGQTSTKEAIVDFRGASQVPFTLQELRSGALLYLDALRAAASTGKGALPSCKP